MSNFDTRESMKIYEEKLEKIIAQANEDYANNYEYDIFDCDAFCKLFADIRGIELFHGATKGVISINGEDDVIFKCPFGKMTKINCCGSEENVDFTYDYCELEWKNYIKSRNEFVNIFFAEVRYLKTYVIGNIVLDFYIQEKARSFEMYGSSGEWDDQTLNSASDWISKAYNLYDVAVDWVADFLAYYSEEDFANLDDFLCDHDINDIHDGNIGYVGDRPVIFDYSGYYD